MTGKSIQRMATALCLASLSACAPGVEWMAGDSATVEPPSTSVQATDTDPDSEDGSLPQETDTGTGKDSGSATMDTGSASDTPPGVTLPHRIEAEDYVGFVDSTPGNSGGAYRTDDVDIEVCGEGGYDVGWTAAGEHLRYALQLDQGGDYELTVRVASGGTGGVFTLAAEGEDPSGDLVVGNTGDWQAYVDVTTTLTLAAGSNSLVLRIGHGEMNFNYLDIDLASGSTEDSDTGVELDTGVEPDTGGGEAIDPWQMIARMGRGTNMGNTLEAPTEGQWAKAAQEYFFDDYKAAGFGSVRIPICWNSRTATNAPYAVDAAFLDHVETIVDWSLARGLVTIIDTHHEEWLMEDYWNKIDRLESLWRQIASRFADKPADLVFEIFNEPHGAMTVEQTNDMNRRILEIIRVDNPTRIVIPSAPSWNGRNAMMNDLDLPNDPYLIASFHFYDPMSFTHDGAPNWGSDAEKQKVRADIAAAGDWSRQEDIPVLVGEFGTKDTAAPDDRLLYYSIVAEAIIASGMAFTVWDDGGWFGIYNRDARSFNGLKDQVIGDGSGPNIP